MVRESVVRALSVGLLGLLVSGSGCNPSPESIDYEVVATLPHDTLAYTQGLLVYERDLMESTGRYGASTLRRVDLESGVVRAEVALDSAHFGEGLARVADELIQLTWKEGTAFVYDAESLELRRTFSYDGEGWGLCYNGSNLYMSNGGSRLLLRDPSTFELVDSVSVTLSGTPVFGLNELECVGRHVYANVFQSDRILKIDGRTGAVVGELDLGSLVLRSGRSADSDAVLNGIAYIEETDLFLVTGKLWPTAFVLRLRP